MGAWSPSLVLPIAGAQGGALNLPFSAVGSLGQRHLDVARKMNDISG